jgi:insulysin
MQQLITSESDKRQYKLIKLDNELRCLLISDMEADKAAAAIDVHIGSGLDPRESYGIAHFLEHMLFQGTEKYPRENEYSEFIKNNGGYENAFTSLSDTNYHFDCSNEAFEEALDRLSQFFICPNFSESSAEREINAVDSEYNQSLQHDGWHYFNLTQVISDPKSNYNRFNCGNK